MCDASIWGFPAGSGEAFEVTFSVQPSPPVLPVSVDFESTFHEMSVLDSNSETISLVLKLLSKGRGKIWVSEHFTQKSQK